MDRNQLSRGILIAVVVLLAGLSAYPPKEKINLGLDLQGGMHLVLQVKTDDAIEAETDNTIDALKRSLEERSLTIETERIDKARFEVLGVPAAQDDEIEEEVVERYFPGWNMARSGDRLRFDLSSSEEKDIRQLSVNQARETIRNRVDAFGVSEPIIHDEGIGSERLVVQLPGVDDPERVKTLIQSTAFLELRLSAANSGAYPSQQQALDSIGGASGFEVFAEDLRDDNKRVTGQRWHVLEERRVITGRDLRTAQMSAGEFNEPVVAFSLTKDGGEKFGNITQASIGRGLAIVLDDRVMSVATIRDRITDQGQISGSFTQREVQDLVTVLRSGALPAGLEILEERTVGPTLGKDSIAKGQRAGLIGGIFVILVMLVVYNLTGINAVFALLLNVVLVFGLLAFFGATLTLPGIAGIVLTVGMAVDANVLIFERIREELRAGRTVKSAIVSGFSKALSSILDANVTTLIAAMFLFMFGTGPIRGFAVTLSVGILCSVFTAVFISRYMFDVLHSRKQRVDKLSI